MLTATYHSGVKAPGFRIEIANMEIMQICAKHAYLGKDNPMLKICLGAFAGTD